MGQEAMRPALLALTLASLLLLPVPAAQAIPELPELLKPVAHNPAERLAEVPIDPPVYDPATGCKPSKRQPGTAKLVAWLGAHAAGVFWGDYRCERWGKGSASLHAERRAIDWHLDARVPAQRKAGEKLVRLLLAPDRAGNPQALARRMGIQEIIWDCGYWAAAAPAFTTYAPCLNRRGERRKRVNATLAHVDHLHVGLSKAGAAGRTSFWAAR